MVLLEGVRLTGCKWIYKKKRSANEKVKTSKTRLVVKRYTKKEKIDYEKTFSLEAMVKSIYILYIVLGLAQV